MENGCSESVLLVMNGDLISPISHPLGWRHLGFLTVPMAKQCCEVVNFCGCLLGEKG